MTHKAVTGYLENHPPVTTVSKLQKLPATPVSFPDCDKSAELVSKFTCKAIYLDGPIGRKREGITSHQVDALRECRHRVRNLADILYDFPYRRRAERGTRSDVAEPAFPCM